MTRTERRDFRPGSKQTLVHPAESSEHNLVTKTAVHELREPVQAVLSFLCVLLEERTGPLSELQRDFLTTADQATRRLKRRIDDLQLVLTEQLDLTIRPEATDLMQRVSDCCHELSQIAVSYGVRLKIDCDRLNHQPWIWADSDRVDQVLLNLIENAIQYSQTNTTVRVCVGMGQHDGWSVTVHNTISEALNEDPSCWFKPHTRGLNGMAARRNGQGLGLAAAEKLVRAQGGDISARIRGRRVAVSVEFPAWQSSPADHLASSHTASLPEWTGI